MTSREEFSRHRHRYISLLSWSLAAILLCAFAVEPTLVNVACAQEKDADQDAVEKESDADEKSKPEKPPVRDNAEADEPASDEEQEKAEDAAGDNVSEDREAADEEEDARAAAEEAAGAEVEVDESGEEEEVTEEEAGGADEKPAPKNGDKKDPDKEAAPVPKRVIGATATIMEKESELLFKARVDSGAKSCSLHIEEYNIKDEEELMADNIGKVITFHIKNGNGESHWLEAKIAGYVVVKTSAHRERRYKVPLKLQYKDFEKEVLVTLNNREKMEFPLLLGRNFLMGDFVVDVEVDNDELHTR